MSTKYSYIRLKIPSLTQGNKNNASSDKWCGRTVAAMIYNYYIANRNPGGLEAVKDELIINQWAKTPYDFVFRGGPRANEPAVSGYNLLPAIQQAKPDGWSDALHLLEVRDSARAAILAGNPLDEGEVIARMRPVLRSIEAFNPAMIYTGLSSSDGLFHDGKRREVRHLVCVSGYRRDADGALWLHIDDPSSRALDGNGDLRPLTIENIMEATKLLGITDAVQQLHPDCVTYENPGRRYWLRAAALFQPNLHSRHSATDFWCDHEDSPGFEVRVNFVPEEMRTMVELGGDPRYPVALSEEGDSISKMWDAVARSGDPYPLSARRSWHNGIHIPYIAEVTDHRVFPIAPGRVVLAWFPPRKPNELDRGMIVMRHAFDTTTLAFVDASEAEPPENAVFVHSLYANLVGGPAGASAVLAKLAPKPTRPELRKFGKVGAPIQLLTEADVVLTPLASEGLPEERPETDLVPVPGTALFALRQENSFVGVWSDAAAADAGDHPHHAVKLRLDAKESRLLGVQLDGKPWVLDGDVIRVKEGYTGTEGRLFRNFKGSGTTRSFPEPAGAVVAVAIDASTTLRPIEVFHSNRLDRALIEVREVISLSDNAAELDEWDRKKKIHDDLAARLCGTSYVDLEGEEPGFRDFTAEQIGLMGVQREDANGLAVGVHVEVFSKENFTKSTTVGGRWTELVEAPGFGNATADFFSAQLDALLSASRSKQGAGGDLTSDPSLQGPAGDAQATSLLSLHEDGTPITITEWLLYCGAPANARWLSQVVAKHRSEWALDLVEDASNKKALQSLPSHARKALFPGPIGGPGLDTDTFYYFHPLRLVEWLSTGINLYLVDLPSAARDGVSIVLRIGDAEVDLVRQGDSDCYRLRMVLGDGAEETEQDSEDDDDAAGTSRGVLILGGIDTMNPEIEIELKRNEIADLAFTQPGGTAVTIRDLGTKKFGTPFVQGGIQATEGEELAVYLLSDLGGPLDDLAVNRAILSFEVRYNVAPPERLQLTMPGAGFSLESLEVSGAAFKKPVGGWGSATTHDLTLTRVVAHDDDDDGDELVTGVSTVLVKATVVATANGRASSSLKMEVSGGDLTEVATGEWQIVQRDIDYDARGQDVAKLQVYLSQILCGAIGCLRGSDGGAVGCVNGHYNEATGRALWRFLLHYRDWSGPSHAIPTKAGQVELDGLARTQAEIEAQVTALYEAHQGPKITQELIDLVVSYYRLPFIGAPIAVRMEPPKLLVPIPEVSKKWSAWNNKSRSRVVPLANALELHFTADVTTSDVPGELASVDITIALEDADAYRLTGPKCNTLSDLVELGLTLVPSGKLTPGAKPKLVVTAATGGLLAAIELGGATDVREGATAVGLDAAMIQHWLRVFPKKKDKGYLDGVDGEFGKNSRTALESFCRDEFKKDEYPTYVQILERLRGDMCTYGDDDLGDECTEEDQCTMEEAAE